jgi:hypothetical protein
MTIRWAFFAFDWSRFTEIKPAMKAACESSSFEDLILPEADVVLEEFDEGSVFAEIANAVILEVCGHGEPVYFEAGLPELIHSLRREVRGEDVAEILGTIISGRPNVEDWFSATNGLIGILTPGETTALASAFAYFRKSYEPPLPPKGLAAITRRFVAVESPLDHLTDLMELIDRTVTSAHGLAVLSET